MLRTFMDEKPFRLPSHRISASWLPRLVPALAGIMLLVVGTVFFFQQEQFRKKELRIFAAREAASHGRLLEKQIEQLQTAATVAALGLTGSIDKPLSQSAGWMEQALRISLSKTTLGMEHDGKAWTLDAGDRQRDSAHTNLPGPNADEHLVPNGIPALSFNETGVRAAQPIHLVTRNGLSRHWGATTAEIRWNALEETALLRELDSEGFYYRLTLVPAAGGQARVIRSSEGMSEQAEIYAIRLPNDDTLRLELTPLYGWATDPFLYVELGLVLAAALLLAMAVHILLSQHWKTRRLLGEHERDLLLSRHLTEAMVDHLPLMVVLRRARDFTIARSNRFAEDLLERDRTALRGQTYATLMPPASVALIDDADRRALAERRPTDIAAYELVTSNGPRILKQRCVPLFGKEGEVDYLLDIAEDVTERDRLETELARQARSLADILATVPVPIYVEDETGVILQANIAFERFFGVARSALSGRTITDGRNGESMHGLPSGVPPAGEAIELTELTTPGPGGNDRLIQVRRAAILDTRNRPIGSVGVVTDLSERVRNERRIEQTNRMLSVVSGTNEAIVRAGTQQELLERTCEILVERGQHPLAWFQFADQAQPLIVRGSPRDLPAQAIRLLEQCDTPCLQHIRSGERSLQICADAACPHPEVMTLAKSHEMSGLALLPVRTRDGFVGTLGAFTGGGRAFSADEIKLLGDLASDISYAVESMAQEEKRREAESKLRLSAQVFENSSEGIMITDAGNRILMVNKAFQKVTGYLADEVIGKNPRILSSGKQDAGFYREMWATIQKRGEWHGEVQNRRKNGEFYTEWLTISAVQNDQDETTNFVAVFTDITSAKQVEERLNFLANYDTLTGLPNRVLFTDRVEQSIASARGEGKQVGILFLDLDRFSLINETFGHSAGDTVLREVSQRIKLAIRPGDSASRMGGDEFAIILPDLERSDEAAKIANRLMQSLAQPFHIEQQEVYTSASIGISMFPDDGHNLEELVKNADSAMYRAMEEGRNTFRFYHSEMNARSAERMSLEGDLRHALARGELVMHYQPFIDSATGRIVGAEALLRWHRPDGGYITPAAFIPMLEETGLIIPVGEWILQTACADNQIWRQHGHSDLFVAVNFSAIQLNDVGVARKLDELLRRTGFDPRHLEIELTESVIMRDAERGIRTLNEFRDIGTRLSIDDFGTGYSSLAYLKKLPIDTLKIDRSFITDTPVEDEAKAIVQAIVAMGHSLDLKIIAEGVQDAAQVNFLRQIRCDLLQGFHFSTALEQTNFLELLKQRSQHPERPWATPK